MSVSNSKQQYHARIWSGVEINMLSVWCKQFDETTCFRAEMFINE